MSAVEEARAASKAHKKWMIEFLQANGGKTTSGDMYEKGEEHHCDTTGAMLKLLKKDKVITFKPMFLMHPMHNAEEISLLMDEAACAGYMDSQG